MVLDAPTRPTVEEWNVPDGYELVDGELVEKHMGAASGRVTVRIGGLLDQYSTANQLGSVLSEVGYRCFPKRNRMLRKPDLSFVRRGRFKDDIEPDGDLTIAPDLVVEVVSPNDLGESLQERVADFLSAGTRLIWMIYPSARVALVYRLDGSMAYVTETKELVGEDVVPGFKCVLRDVLTNPKPAKD